MIIAYNVPGLRGFSKPVHLAVDFFFNFISKKAFATRLLDSAKSTFPLLANQRCNKIILIEHMYKMYMFLYTF